MKVGDIIKLKGKKGQYEIIAIKSNNGRSFVVEVGMNDRLFEVGTDEIIGADITEPTRYIVKKAK